MPNTLQAEDPICPECGQDDIECLENCTLHKRVHCGYSEDNCWDCGVNAEEESIGYGICTECRHSICTDCQDDLHCNGRREDPVSLPHQFRDDNARCGTSERVL